MKYLRFMLAIILMLLVVIIIVQNHTAMSTQVEFKVNLLFIEYATSAVSIYFVVTTAFLFGILIMGFYGMIERFRLKREIKVLSAASREKDTELNSLRNLPITTDDVSAVEGESSQED